MISSSVFFSILQVMNCECTSQHSFVILHLHCKIFLTLPLCERPHFFVCDSNAICSIGKWNNRDDDEVKAVQPNTPSTYVLMMAHCLQQSVCMHAMSQHFQWRVCFFAGAVVFVPHLRNNEILCTCVYTICDGHSLPCHRRQCENNEDNYVLSFYSSESAKKQKSVTGMEFKRKFKRFERRHWRAN